MIILKTNTAYLIGLADLTKVNAEKAATCIGNIADYLMVRGV